MLAAVASRRSSSQPARACAASARVRVRTEPDIGKPSCPFEVEARRRPREGVGVEGSTLARGREARQWRGGPPKRFRKGDGQAGMAQPSDGTAIDGPRSEEDADACSTASGVEGQVAGILVDVILSHRRSRGIQLPSIGNMVTRAITEPLPVFGMERDVGWHPPFDSESTEQPHTPTRATILAPEFRRTAPGRFEPLAESFATVTEAPESADPEVRPHLSAGAWKCEPCHVQLDTCVASMVVEPFRNGR